MRRILKRGAFSRHFYYYMEIKFMQKITLAALSLALTFPTVAAPAQQATKPATTKKTSTTKPAASTAKTSATAKPTTTGKTTAPAAKPVLLSKIITPDGKTPVKNVKTTPVPDVSPTSRGQYVVINIPQQRLFLYNNGALEKVYPVAVGKAVTQTNLGEHKIGGKAFDPTWHIPKSIQAELKDGRTTVPPGPENPLGPVFVRLGNPKLGLGIHGTNAPASVPGVRSHGCVRMKSEQAMDFANTITTGSDAIVSYEMATLNVDSKNQLWLTAFKDPYSKNNLNVDALKKSIQAWATANNIKISDARINQIIKARRATPVCISCAPKAKPAVSGSLMSIAWNSGTAALTTPKGMKTALPPVMEEDNLDEIEVDADVAKTATPATPAKTPAKPATTTSKGKTPAVAAPATEKPLKPTTTEETVIAPAKATAPAKSTSKTTTTPVKAAPAKAASEVAAPVKATPAKQPAPKAATPIKTDKLKIKSTSAFDDNTNGAEPEGTPLYPAQPIELKPIDSSKTQSKAKATAIKTAAQKAVTTATAKP